MRRYETTVIVDPDIPEDQRKAFVEKTGELIPRLEGFLLTMDDWGNRKLAYEIKRKMRGHYYRFDYCGNGACVNEIERSFRIDDRSLKYMTVLLDENANLEALKEEIAKAKEVAKAKAEEEAKTKVEAKPANKATTDAIKPEEDGEDDPITRKAYSDETEEENEDAEEV